MHHGTRRQPCQAQLTKSMLASPARSPWCCLKRVLRAKQVEAVIARRLLHQGVASRHGTGNHMHEYRYGYRITVAVGACELCIPPEPKVTTQRARLSVKIHRRAVQWYNVIAQFSCSSMVQFHSSIFCWPTLGTVVSRVLPSDDKSTPP